MMKKLSFFMVISILPVYVLTQAEEEVEVPEVVCHAVENAPVIDGYIAENQWKTGQILTQFHQLGWESSPAKLPSLAIFLYDEEKLYLAMLLGKNINDKISDSLWHEGVEIFIDPDRTHEKCFQIAGNPKSTWTGAYPADGSPDESWTPEMEFAARQLTGGWLLEMSISFLSLGASPKPGDVWGVNVCRNDSHAGHITLAPLKRAFYEPEGFCNIKFAETNPKEFTELPQPGAVSLNNMLKQLSGKISLLTDAGPAKKMLVKHLFAVQGTVKKIEEEAAENPVLASFYREWTYSSLQKMKVNDIHWRLMISQLLE